MRTSTHGDIACAIYDALPRAAQDFLRLSDIELRHWARVPDEQDRDALLVTGCEVGEEAHAHSYKLAADGKTHLTGSAPTVIAQAPRECVSAVREGQFDDAREIMVKTMSHYAADLCTPWHVTRELTSDQHTRGEAALGKITLPLPLVPATLASPRSLYQSCVAVAEETHALFVDKLAAGVSVGDLGNEILAHAAGFGLTVAHYIWHYIERA